MKNYSKILMLILLVGSSCQVSASTQEIVEPISSQSKSVSDGYYDAHWLKYTFRERSVWERFSGKMNNIWTNFKRRHIPTPKLMNHQDLVLDNKKCEMFQYNISSDNAEVKKLREQLGINGVYFSIDSDKDLCSKLPENIKYDESLRVNAHLFKLLESIASLEKSGKKLSDNPALEDAYIQLIWEAESVLPQDFDNDSDKLRSKIKAIMLLFIEFIPYSNKGSTAENEMNKLMRVVESKETIKNYLSIWKRYTARFQSNSILHTTIEILDSDTWIGSLFE